MCLSVKTYRPDAVLAEGRHDGFEWAIVHNGRGYRCGYVKVEAGHPWFGLDLNDLGDIDVHGGITFAEPDVRCDKGGPDDGYWLGFDCCHSGDAPDPTLPGYVDPGRYGLPTFSRFVARVKTTDFVESHCRRLCEQAAVALSESSS